MPVYAYRAMTRSGQEVKNKVEDVNRLSLIKKIKRNNLIPISVTQLNTNKMKSLNKQTSRSNDIEAIKRINTNQVNNQRRKITLKERISLIIATGEKITRQRPSNFYTKFLFA